MTEKFNNENYKKAYEKIELSEEQKRLLTEKMRLADAKNCSEQTEKIVSYDTFAKTQKHRKNMWLRILAATLCVMLVVCAAPFALNKLTNKSENSFMIVAKAADTSSDTVVDENGVKIDCGQYGTLILQEKDDISVHPYLDKNGKENLFCDFNLTSFRIVGNNIKSIKFKLNGNKQYFSFWADDSFTDIKPLSQSGYSEDELLEHIDGCDADTFSNEFTYINKIPGENQSIVLDNKLNIINESDRSNSEIDKIADEYFKNVEKINEWKTRLYYETGGVGTHDTPEEYEKIYNAISEEMDEILKLQFEGMTMDITVNYEDGSTQTKKFNIGYEMVEDVSQNSEASQDSEVPQTGEAQKTYWNWITITPAE